MNYDAEITNLIARIKADKSIVQPWRNKTVSRLDEAQAFIAMGRRMTNLQPPEEQAFDYGRGGVVTSKPTCICPDGARDSTCPVQH